MYCRHCGKENVDQASFCSACGKQISEASGHPSENKLAISTSHRGFSRKWIIISVPLMILVVIVLFISFSGRQEGPSARKNAINPSGSIPLLHDENIGFSLDTVDGYMALNTRIPQHDCEIRTFEDKNPYFTLKKSLDEKFGKGTSGSFFIFDYLHWKDQEDKNLYLILNKNETIFIHSRSNIETMGFDLIMTAIQELKK